jgi:tetratricopeptide (TPR) repeat protein
MGTPMSEIGRNDPCPCGSGKKFKKCCLTSREAESAREYQVLNEARAKEAAARRDQDKYERAAMRAARAQDDDLDEVSNRVVDLLEAGRIGDAELACQELLTRFPDVPDGLDRLGMIHEKSGNPRAAADCYRRAAAFESKTYETDEEYRTFLRDKADELDPPTKPQGATQ